MDRFLAQEFPGIESADTEFSDRNALNISIVEKKPMYLWCAGPCYFTDDSGLVYEPAPTFTPGFFVSFSGSTPSGTISDPTDPIRERFASRAEFSKTVSVIAELAAYPMHVIGVKYLSLADSTPTLATGVGDVALSVDQIKDSVIPNAAQLYVLQSQDAQAVAQALDLVLSDKNFQAQLDADPSALQYIDLRFNGKIYYKFASAIVPPSVPPIKKSSIAPAIKKSSH